MKSMDDGYRCEGEYRPRTHQNLRIMAYLALKYTDKRLSVIGRGGIDCRMASRLGGEIRLNILSSCVVISLLSVESSSSGGLLPGPKSDLSSFIYTVGLTPDGCKREVVYIVEDSGPMRSSNITWLISICGQKPSKSLEPLFRSRNIVHGW
jgi:hypothetical protein